MRGKRLVKSVLERAGWDVERVDDDTLVVRRSGGGRRVLQLGDGRIGVHLLVDDDRSRKFPGMLQKRVGEYLAAEQVGWLLRATEADLVLDVGANVGQY